MQTLKFFGYWDTFGYENYVDFGSTFRIELIQNVKTDKFYVQFTYNDKIINFPWCNNVNDLCPMEEFIQYAAKNVILDYEYVDQFCYGEAGVNYIVDQTKQEEL